VAAKGSFFGDPKDKTAKPMKSETKWALVKPLRRGVSVATQGNKRTRAGELKDRSALALQRAFKRALALVFLLPPFLPFFLPPQGQERGQERGARKGVRINQE